MIVLGEMIGDTGDASVHIAAAQIFGAHDFTRRGLHQRRTTEKDRALVANDHGFVAHRRHIRAASGARAHHAGDLRNAQSRQVRLVIEDAAEMFLIREHFILHGQERAAGVDQVHAGQAVLTRDFLSAQMFLYGDRIVRAAL